MRTLIIGYGRMGKLVASLCPEYGLEVAGTVDIAEAGAPDQWPAADVAIDFSVADAVPQNVRRLADRGVNIVIGTETAAFDEKRRLSPHRHPTMCSRFRPRRRSPLLLLEREPE